MANLSQFDAAEEEAVVVRVRPEDVQHATVFQDFGTGPSKFIQCRWEKEKKKNELSKQKKKTTTKHLGTRSSKLERAQSFSDGDARTDWFDVAFLGRARPEGGRTRRRKSRRKSRRKDWSYRLNRRHDRRRRQLLEQVAERVARAGTRRSNFDLIKKKKTNQSKTR